MSILIYGPAHYACDLSGEEQPPFRGWFRPAGGSFWEIDPPPVEWMPLEESES